MHLVLYLDEPLVAEAMRFVFNQTDDVVVDGILDDVAQLVPEVQKCKPDVLLLSLTPALHLEILRQLREVAPNCRIVLWTLEISHEVAHQAMELGIRGILPRTYSTELVLKCLHKVHQGELWFDKELTASYVTCHRVALTPRQSQLVQMVAGGFKNKEIAAALSITEGTVKVYLSRLFEKLGTKDRFELAKIGVRNLRAGEQTGQNGPFDDSRLKTLYLETSNSTS